MADEYESSYSKVQWNHGGKWRNTQDEDQDEYNMTFFCTIKLKPV